MTRLAALLFVLGACGSDGADDCDPPTQPEYSCAAVALGTPDTCSGGAPVNGMATDPDKAFPIGCQVELPICVAAFPNEVQTCTCTEFGDDVPQWVCPV